MILGYIFLFSVIADEKHTLKFNISSLRSSNPSKIKIHKSHFTELSGGTKNITMIEEKKGYLMIPKHDTSCVTA